MSTQSKASIWQAEGKAALVAGMCSSHPERCLSNEEQLQMNSFAGEIWRTWAGPSAVTTPEAASPFSECTEEDVCSANHPPVFLFMDKLETNGGPNASALISREADGRCVKVVLVNGASYPFFFPGGRFDRVNASTLLTHEVGHHIFACRRTTVRTAALDETFADLCGGELAMRMGISRSAFELANCSKFGASCAALSSVALPEDPHGSSACRQERTMSHAGSIDGTFVGPACGTLSDERILQECTPCVYGTGSLDRHNFCLQINRGRFGIRTH